jgi:4-amino-4-deoxy-L-arabinose transferase-like glycosyltransferase
MGLGLFFYRLGAPGLMDPDEGRYAEIGREMVALKDWFIPHLNLFPYLEKPPLVYWFTALSFKFLGQNELAARLPSALSALGGLFLAYGLGRVFWGPLAGFSGAMVLASCSGYVVLGRLLTLDMTFSLLLNLSIGLGYLALSRDRSELWPWAYGVLGLAVLAKGPVALVLAGLIWGVWVVWWRRQSWKSLVQPWSWLLLALLVLPWFVYVQWRFPDYFRFFILEQHFGRFLTPAIHPEPFYYYVPVLLGLLLPWTFLLPWALGRQGTDPDSEPDKIFLLIWAAAVLVLFSLSRGKLTPYILPALLPLALLVGQRLSEIPGQDRRWRKDFGLNLSLWFWITVGFILVLMVHGSTLDHNWSRLNMPRSYLLLVSVVFTMTPILAWTNRRVVLFFLGAGALILSILLPVGLEHLSQGRSPRELGRMVQAHWQPDDALVGMYLYSQGLSFYSSQVFHLMESRTELDFGRKMAPARERDLYFDSLSDLVRFARSRPEVFLYIKEQHLEGLRPELPGKIRLLGRQRDCLLVAYEAK